MPAPAAFTKELQSLKLICGGEVDGDGVGDELGGRGLVTCVAGLPVPPVLTEQAARLAATATTAHAATARPAIPSRTTR
jgi:hypothetical protein